MSISDSGCVEVHSGPFDFPSKVVRRSSLLCYMCARDAAVLTHLGPVQQGTVVGDMPLPLRSSSPQPQHCVTSKRNIKPVFEVIELLGICRYCISFLCGHMPDIWLVSMIFFMYRPIRCTHAVTPSSPSKTRTHTELDAAYLSNSHNDLYLNPN